MITRIEALSYRCLRYVSRPLDRFHVLTGPNASGKTTFLDVVAFLGRLVSGGLEEAIRERTQNFQEKRSPGRFRDWVAHLQTALPDLESVRVVERKDDRHRYLMLRYRGGLEIPSWMASDGTLRLLTLTLLAYLEGFRGIYLTKSRKTASIPAPLRACFSRFPPSMKPRCCWRPTRRWS